MGNKINKKIPIVDFEDNILFYQDRKVRVKSDQIYRVAALWITNSKGKILLARRAFTKIHNPGQWGPAVAGAIEEGEDYYSNITK